MGTQLLRKFLAFMTLVYGQIPTIETHPEPDEADPHFLPHFSKINFNMILQFMMDTTNFLFA